MNDAQTAGSYDAIAVLAKLRSAVQELRMSPGDGVNEAQMKANNSAIQDVVYLIERFEAEIA